MADQAMIRVLNGERLDPPPVWIMRQAGRYLPEYRELRTKAKDFLAFCYTPELAVEAVMQPLRRFDLDAAILFSDILVLPDALGHKVWFVEGEGPRLDPLYKQQTWNLGGADKVVERLAPVYETVERLRAALPAHIPLIGFAGGPWTVSTYMIQGEGGDKDLARLTAYRRPADVDALLADGPGRGRRRLSANLRELVGRPARTPLRAHDHQSDQGFDAAAARPWRHGARDRLSARGGRTPRPLCAGDRRDRAGR
jgi:uroporphyrinogen decarboxylase